ncbi:MAG: NAD(P)/FAD-dependent oxidoreductase [Pseudomonadota bacterium]
MSVGAKVTTDLAIIGAGPAGALLAILAARRGQSVALYERRGDPRSTTPEAGRSINLALAARGMRALDAVRVLPQVQPLLVRMPGRQLHLADGGEAFNAYGLPGETNYSISRVDLTRCLVEAAGHEPRVALHFRQRCSGLADSGAALMVDEDSGREFEVQATRIVGADGAGSALRKALAQQGHASASNELLDHDYRELSIPAVNGSSALAVREALHIWPRRGHMLIALPNADFSFTATLFLPRTGPVSFASLEPPAAARAFFAREFPDALALMPDFGREFAVHRQGILGTVRCTPWNLDERVLLIGDAAHAIVPFHGQGMNCALEDCLLLDALLADGAPAPFARFNATRRADTDAIAAMSLENYGEMRDEVLDPVFQRQQALSLELERRHPGRFIPRYSMVMFHPEIAYSVALARGNIQQQILDELTRDAEPDLPRADRLIDARLPALP